MRAAKDAGLLAALALLLGSCGQQGADFAAVSIEKAERSGERILVAGGWGKGVSTPPLCRVLEDADGPASGRFGTDARVTLDGSTFSRKFIPTEDLREESSGSWDAYHVRCTVSLSSGRSREDTVKVSETP